MFLYEIFNTEVDYVIAQFSYEMDAKAFLEHLQRLYIDLYEMRPISVSV